MGANLLYRTAYMNAAVTINHEMITYAAHSALPVPAVNIRYGEVATFLGRTAMNDGLPMYIYMFFQTQIVNHYPLTTTQTRKFTSLRKPYMYICRNKLVYNI